MCLILFAYNTYPGYRLILAANRDEFYARSTQQARFWTDHPTILGGRDLEQGGTWLGVTKRGRMAALTNYRDPAGTKQGARSRGLLVKDFLTSSLSVREYAAGIHRAKDQYNGFNLLMFDAGAMWYYSNYTGVLQQLTAGIYGLSNHLLNTPWPKVQEGKHRFAESLLKNGRVNTDDLLAVLAEQTPATDEQLPHTGLSYEWEKLLSARFIHGKTYGTRASTLLVLDCAGGIDFIERSFGSTGAEYGDDMRVSFTVG